MSKRKLFIDFDSTIVDSISAFCDSYNKLYRDHPRFIPATPCKVEKWNFKDQCPLVEDTAKIFASELFFRNVDFINGNTKEIIEQLCEKYDVILITIGSLQNIALKSMWLYDYLPCIKEHIFLVNNGCKMDKGIVDMEGDTIFIDDVDSNLKSTNAKHKIIFGDIYDWNVDSQYPRAFNWTDLSRLLL